jgi:hypothetical protein
VTGLRPILKLARKEAEVRRLDHESDWHFSARCAAIRLLGERWQRHPSYASPARHSVLPAVFEPARSGFLAEIARRAAADRSRNPVHQQWERVRAVLGEQA